MHQLRFDPHEICRGSKELVLRAHGGLALEPLLPVADEAVDLLGLGEHEGEELVHLRLGQLTVFILDVQLLAQRGEGGGVRLGLVDQAVLEIGELAGLAPETGDEVLEPIEIDPEFLRRPRRRVVALGDRGGGRLQALGGDACLDVLEVRPGQAGRQAKQLTDLLLGQLAVQEHLDGVLGVLAAGRQRALGVFIPRDLDDLHLVVSLDDLGFGLGPIEHLERLEPMPAENEPVVLRNPDGRELHALFHVRRELDHAILIELRAHEQIHVDVRDRYYPHLLAHCFLLSVCVLWVSSGRMKRALCARQPPVFLRTSCRITMVPSVGHSLSRQTVGSRANVTGPSASTCETA